MKLSKLSVPLVLALVTSLHAQVLFNGSYTQDFNTLALGPNLTEPWTDNSTPLPGWYFGQRGGSTSYISPTVYYYRSLTPGQTVGANPGPMSTALGSNNSDRSLGVQPSTGSSVTSTGLPMAMGLRLTNVTGASIGVINLSFALEQWSQGYSAISRNEQLAFSYSTTATGLSVYGGANTYTDVPGLLFTSPVATQTSVSTTTYALDGNNAANRSVYTNYQLTVAGGWAAGTDLWLRWSVPSNLPSGSRGGIISIDDLTVSTVIPEPGTYAAMAGALALLFVGIHRRRHQKRN